MGGGESPFPKPLVIWASPSDVTLVICVRVRVTGDAHITRVWGMGMPISLRQPAPPILYGKSPGD